MKNILVVEDDFILATDLGETLQELVGGNIRIARSVRDALAAISDEIDLATIDVKVDGEACLAVVNALEEKGIPYVYVTGYPAADHVQLPEAPWITKPVDVAVLRKAIDTVTAKVRGPLENL